MCPREHPRCELAWEELGMGVLVLPGGMRRELCPAGIPSWFLPWIILNVLMGAKQL